MWVYCAWRLAKYTSFQAVCILIKVLVPLGLVDSRGNKYGMYLTDILCYRHHILKALRRQGLSLELLHCFIIRPKRCFASGESWIYAMGPKNGLHAVGYNSAESEPIWMKSGIVWVNCSRLLSTEVEFYWKTQQNRVLCHPLGDLGVTYTVHLWFIGKRVVDFLLMLIELLSPVGGGRPPTTVGVRKLESQGYDVALFAWSYV